MKIKNIFLDLDDTILDFQDTERQAITGTLREFGIEPSDDIVSLYVSINHSCWEAFERGEMTKEDVLTRRFELLFSKLGVDEDAHKIQSFYEKRLAEGCKFLEGAKETLDELYGKYDLYITSNGTAFVQDRRIAASGIAGYFNDIFISERMGANKPKKEFFDACFEKMKNKDRAATLIVGDSLTSDVLGGINAGVRTCHITLGKRFEYNAIVPEFAINMLSEIFGVLDTLENQ